MTSPTAHASLLRKLIHSANWQSLEALIQENPDPTLYTEPLPCGQTPLQLASLLGATKTVSYLLALGLSPSDKTAQTHAARNGHLTVLRLLLPPAFTPCSPTQCTCQARVPAPGHALHAAVWHAHLPAAHHILSALCPRAKYLAVAWTAPDGGSVLHAAALSGNAALCDALIAVGANLDATDASRLRPIDWARRFVVATGRGSDVVTLLQSAEKKARLTRLVSAVENNMVNTKPQNMRAPGKVVDEERQIAERAPCVPRSLHSTKNSAAPACHAV